MAAHTLHPPVSKRSFDHARPVFRAVRQGTTHSHSHLPGSWERVGLRWRDRSSAGPCLFADVLGHWGNRDSFANDHLIALIENESSPDSEERVRLEICLVNRRAAAASRSL